MSTAPSGSRAVSRQVLADHVYEELLAGLMDGRFAPDSAISIDGMARELSVSPTPVREALARLEHTGMVRRLALKGYRVAPMYTADDYAELMAARLVIEPVNTGLAWDRRTPKFLAELGESIVDLKRAPRGPSFAEFRDYLDADERLHRLIAENSGNQFMLGAYRSLGGQVQRFRLFGGVGITDADEAIAEHEAIFAAMESGTREEVVTAMGLHISQVRSRAIADARATH